MVCLGLEPGVAGWKAQTNLLSYGGTPKESVNLYNLYSVGVDVVGLSMLFRARR